MSHFSKVYVPCYSFHEGLGHDLMLIGLKYISFLISNICCVCSHLRVIVKHFLQVHYLLIAYTKHSFMKTQRPNLRSYKIRRVETLIEYGKYHKLEGIYPHFGLHISLLADGNIHYIKLIYTYISNNDVSLLTFCGVYHGNSPDIKGNPPYKFLIF